jgi:hypothetical protein
VGKRKVFIFTGFLGNALLMFSLTLAPTMSALLVSSQPYNVYKYAINTPYNSTL